MTRLLINDSWYDLVDPSSYFEQDFEDRILGAASNIFAGWVVVPFKCNVHARDSGYGTKRPDLALIHPSYREWWVVEIEMSHHSLADHVLPQVAAFSLGAYDAKHAAYMQARRPEFDGERLEMLVGNVAPGVAVVVNDDVPGWHPHLDRYNAKLCVVKSYRSALGHVCNIVTGSLPSPDSSLLSRCQRADGLPRALALLNPGVAVASPGATVTIETPSGASTWTFERLSNASFLFSTGRYPFGHDVRLLELHQDSNGRLRLEPVTRRQAWTSR